MMRIVYPRKLCVRVSPRSYYAGAYDGRRAALLRNSRRTIMKHLIIPLLLAGGFLALSTVDASAVVCARGVYRAGCVGPRGAAVVRPPLVHPVIVAPRRGGVVRPRGYWSSGEAPAQNVLRSSRPPSAAGWVRGRH